jgi:hypothetical protein
VLFGGGHGDGEFRFHAKTHLSSPLERKKSGDLSFGCPLTLMCNLEYRKDTHGLLLANTVMKAVSDGIKKLIKSACIVIHNSTRNGTDFSKATLVSGDINKIQLGLNGTSFKYTEITSPNEWKVIPIPEELCFLLSFMNEGRKRTSVESKESFQACGSGTVPDWEMPRVNLLRRNDLFHSTSS